MIEGYRGVRPSIHPTAWVHPTAVVIGEVELGPGVSVWPCAVLRGDQGPLIVGRDTNIQDGVTLHNTGGKSITRVGARVTVGHRALLHGCVVGDDVLVGMGSILLDNAQIASGTMIGAGALVPPNKEIPGGVLALGSPAAVRRELTQEDIDWIDYSWKNYQKTMKAYASIAYRHGGA